MAFKFNPISSELDLVSKDMNWLGEWRPKEYKKNDVVRDQEYTMVANKTTNDRPSPQPEGELSWTLPVTPVWTDAQITDVVRAGIRVTNVTELWQVSTIRVWIPSVDTNAHYRVIIYDQNSGISTIGQEFDGDILNQPGWATLQISPLWILPGSDLIFFVNMWNSSSEITISANWNFTSRTDLDSDPGTGNTTRTVSDLSKIRISKTDRDSGDQTTVLDSVKIGSIIRVAQDSDVNKYFEYEVIDEPIDNGTWYLYPVTRISTGTGGDSNLGNVLISFSNQDLSPVDYVQADNEYSGQLSLTGLLKLGTADTIENLNSYGIDIQVQRYVASPDWDLLAVSGSGLSTGGVSILNDLTDVDGAPADRQRLTWNESKALWEPQFSTSALGFAEFDYRFNTSNDETPTSGHIQYNDDDPALATIMYVHEEDRVGNDLSLFWSELQENDWLNLHDPDDVDGRHQRFDVTGAVTKVDDTYHIPISFFDQAGADFTNNYKLRVFVRYQAFSVQFQGAGTSGYVPDPIKETGRVLYDNASWRLPEVELIEFTDDFNRADGILTAPWEVIQVMPVISDNEARAGGTSSTGAWFSACKYEFGMSDYIISLDMRLVGVEGTAVACGIAFRVEEDTNDSINSSGFSFGRKSNDNAWAIQYLPGDGAPTVDVSWVADNGEWDDDGVRLTVACKGMSVKCYVDDVLIFDTVLADNVNSTGVGMRFRSSSSSDYRYDNFRVTSMTEKVEGIISSEDNAVALFDGQTGKKIKQTNYRLPVIDGLSGQALITDGNGNVTWGAVSAGQATLGLDFFEDEDGTPLTSHLPNIGGEYEVDIVFGTAVEGNGLFILNNQVVTRSSANETWAGVLETNTENLEITGKIMLNGAPVSFGRGLIVRWIDNLNHMGIYLQSGEVRLIERINGTPTTLFATAYVQTAENTIRAIVRKDNYRIWVNGQLLIDGDSTRYNTQTKHGIACSSSITPTVAVDNFAMLPVNLNERVLRVGDDQSSSFIGYIGLKRANSTWGSLDPNTAGDYTIDTLGCNPGNDTAFLYIVDDQDNLVQYEGLNNLSVTIKGLGSIINYQDPFMDGSLVGKYLLDDNGSDLISGDPGIETNISYEDFKFSRGAVFDGTSLIAVNTVDLNSVDFSFSWYQKITNIKSGNYVFGNGGTTNDSRLHVGFRSTTVFTVAFFFNDVNVSLTQDTLLHHFVVTHNATTLISTVYMDGRLIGSGTHPQNSIADFDRIGGVFNTSSFEGTVDQVELYDRVLTLPEVQILQKQYNDSDTTFDFSWDSVNSRYDVIDSRFTSLMVNNMDRVIDVKFDDME